MTREIEISARLITWPRMCACCLGDAEDCYTAEARRAKSYGADVRTWDVPCCDACLDHVDVALGRSWGWGVKLSDYCACGRPNELPVAYQGWNGSVHTFEFANDDYADKFVKANRSKVISDCDIEGPRRSSAGVMLASCATAAAFGVGAVVFVALLARFASR